MHTEVDNKHLPLKMASPNVMVVPYTTNVLFPKLGPLAVKRYVRVVARLLSDYSAMIKASELEKKRGGVNRKGRDRGQAFRQNPAFLDPRLGEKVNYSDFIDEFKHFNRHYLYNEKAASPPKFGRSPVVVPGTTSSIVSPSGAVSSGSINLGNSIFAERITESNGLNIGAPGVSVSDLGNVGSLNLNVDSRIDGAALSTVEVSGDGRLIEGNTSPAQVMLPGGSIVQPLSLPADGGFLTQNQIDERRTQQEESYDTALLYSWMAQPNAIASDLFSSGAMAKTGSVFSKEVLEANNSADALGKSLQRVAKERQSKLKDTFVGYTDERIKEVGIFVDMGFAFCQKLDVDLGDMPARYTRDANFKTGLILYIITRIDTTRPISDRLVPLPSDTAIVESREWAFQRRERLDISVGTPSLRGPTGAEGVTPNSELSLTESNLVEQFEGFQTSQSNTSESTSREAGLSVQGFQLALSSMTESGTISDQSFQTDTALVSTLKERRRERINEVIDSVSNANGTQNVRSSRQARSSSREYTTRGKDAVFSTTEVSFQVAAQATVEVFLEDVDLVWCPRIEVPFLYLHKIVLDERRRSEERYLAQNQVSDPTRPTLRYETASFDFEIAIKGDVNYQLQEFSRRPPSNISGSDDAGGQWEIDRATSDVRFRNGDGDDYDWTQRGNWDDLEVHNEEFVDGPYLTPGGDVRGSAFLETTDPEYWNKGFMAYTIVMRRLDAGTVTALAEWERSRGEAIAERQSVEVRAKQYGELKMREMITRFENMLEQRNEVFSSLIKLVYAGITPQHRSFYSETISSSIDWSRAAMKYEQPDLNTLPFVEYPPTHFMNVSHVRLVLPINRSAEDAFFESLSNADTYHSAAASDVREFVDKYRDRLEELKAAGQDKLDSYSREMVLGNHVEAVLSHHPFAE